MNGDTERDQNQRDPFADFDGYEVPRYTQVPDQLFDEHLPYLGHAELKVLLFIIRRTFGWGKSADAISLSQLERGTGLSRRSVREAVKSLEQKRLIVADRCPSPRGDPSINVYRLNIKGQAGPGAIGTSSTSPPGPGASETSGETGAPAQDKSTPRTTASSEGGRKNLPGGRGESTLPQGTFSPTVGEKVPYPQESTESRTTLETSLQQTEIQQTSLSLQPEATSLAEAFFQALGYTRVPRKKRERAISTITQLLEEGFTPAEIRAAIELAAIRGARDAGILPYVIGEAVAANLAPPSPQGFTRDAPFPQVQSSENAPPAEDTYEEILMQIRTLPPDQQEALRQAAIARLGSRNPNPAVVEGIMIGLYQRGFPQSNGSPPTPHPPSSPSDEQQ